MLWLLLLVTPAAAAAPTSAAGEFAVQLLGPPTLTQIGANCQLEAPILIDFLDDGTLKGQALGEIDVLVLATCAEVATHPPGTFADHFEANVTFAGTIAGHVGTTQVIYKGNTRPGGDVSAKQAADIP